MHGGALAQKASKQKELSDHKLVKASNKRHGGGYSACALDNICIYSIIWQFLVCSGARKWLVPKRCPNKKSKTKSVTKRPKTGRFQEILRKNRSSQSEY